MLRMLKRGQGGGHRGGGVEVRFFGEFEAIEAGVPVPVRGTKQGTVLALLALHRGRRDSTFGLLCETFPLSLLDTSSVGVGRGASK